MNGLIRAIIDTNALRHNLQSIRKRAAGSRVMAVVKANAYGHGLVNVAHALPDADALAVARIDEAITLRSAGVRHPIVVLEGVFSAEQLQEAAVQNLEIVVHDPVQIELLERFRGPEHFPVWIKIDTGMNRLGFRPSDFPKVLERVRAVKASKIRLMTHLARAEERDCPMTREQIARFSDIASKLPYETSICNSAGIFVVENDHGNWLRPGLALYGASPIPRESAASFGLKPVMTIETTVIATRRVRAGETVGYGGAWKAARDSTVAILAGGYGDGLPRSLDNGTPVIVDGKRAPMVGRVSMDMTAVDVTDIPNVHVGMRGSFWGQGISVEEVAVHAGTIPYELLCGVNQRVPLYVI